MLARSALPAGWLAGGLTLGTRRFPRLRVSSSQWTRAGTGTFTYSRETCWTTAVSPAGGAVECWEVGGEFLGSIPGPFTEIDVGYTYADIPYACGLLADGRILCWDLMEEVFRWAAAGLEEYTHPICVPELISGGYMCWNADSQPPNEIDDRYVIESPILLPHSNSALYPDGGSG